MSASPSAVAHGIFTLNRSWNTTPARVFAAWSDIDIKAQWFPGMGDGLTLLRRELDFRVGGTEVLEGIIAANGKKALYEARFHVIEPNRRLVYDYDLHHDANFHSVTLSSLTIEPDGKKTNVSYTEQIVFLDGEDGTASRHHGTELQWAGLEAALLGKEASR
jgi:uncharacterized protein YndB with AHSA1/START domain